MITVEFNNSIVRAITQHCLISSAANIIQVDGSNSRTKYLTTNIDCYCIFKLGKQHIIGVTLSEPHTSVTALHTCTCVCVFACCLLGLTTYHKFQMSAIKYFTKTMPTRAKVLQLSRVKGYCQTVVSKLLKLNGIALPGKLLSLTATRQLKRVRHRRQKLCRFASGKHRA